MEYLGLSPKTVENQIGIAYAMIKKTTHSYYHIFNTRKTNLTFLTVKIYHPLFCTEG